MVYGFLFWLYAFAPVYCVCRSLNSNTESLVTEGLASTMDTAKVHTLQTTVILQGQLIKDNKQQIQQTAKWISK